MSLKTQVTKVTPIMDVPTEHLFAYVWFDGFGDGPMVTTQNIKVIGSGPSTMELGWTELVLEDMITGSVRVHNLPNDTVVTWHVLAEDVED